MMVPRRTGGEITRRFDQYYSDRLQEKEKRLLHVTNNVLMISQRDSFRFSLFLPDDPDTQFIMDSMQESLQCCGSGIGPADWERNM